MKILRADQLRTLGTLLVLGLAAANCGDGDSTSASAGSAGTSGSAGTAGKAGSSGDAGSGGSTGGTSGAAGSTGGTAGSAGTGGTAGTAGTAGTGGSGNSLSFFVSSTGSKTANFGGLAGADKRCQDLAAAVGAGGKTWHAYLSTETGSPNDGPVHAKDRIGKGPWYNAKGVMVAADLTTLHEAFGDYMIFLDEKGEPINGQWPGSPQPNEHDILTGTQRDGTVLVGQTCDDWTSEDPVKTAQVGHSDGLGPGGSNMDMYRPWNAVHPNGNCGDTAPKGGSGRIYCFATD